MSSWYTVAVRFVGVVLLLLAIGSLVGMSAWFLAVGMTAYSSYHLLNMARLERWLDAQAKSTLYPPSGVGTWSVIFDHLYRSQLKKRSERRRMSDMLRRFRESTAAMPDGVIVLQGLNIEWFNDSAARLLSLEADDVGQRLDNLVRHPAFIRYLGRKVFDNPIDLPAPSLSEVLLQLHVIPYTEDESLVLIRDITQLRGVETMRKDFIANASHELRTPLTVVRGYVDMLQQDMAQLPPMWHAGINSMSAQIRRMELIIQDLLELNRLESEPVVEHADNVPVADMITSIVDDVRSLSDSHNIYVDVDHALLLEGHKDELFSLFSNLISNAVKYSPDGGDIVVLWQANSDGKPMFSVSDGGVGIPPEHVSRLTERFYRVHDVKTADVQGTGLGLAIVKHVLDRHEAKLRIRSEVSSGSTFSCVFPANRAVQLATAPSPLSLN